MEIFIIATLICILSLAIYGLFFAKHEDVKIVEEVPEFNRSGYAPSYRTAATNYTNSDKTLDFLSSAVVYDIISSDTDMPASQQVLDVPTCSSDVNDGYTSSCDSSSNDSGSSGSYDSSSSDSSGSFGDN